MKIIMNKEKSIREEAVVREYSYRLTENYRTTEGTKSYFGIEIERRDFEDGELVKVLRDGEKIISEDYNKVEKILNKAYEYEVSPIHFIDIFGEEIDLERYNM